MHKIHDIIGTPDKTLLDDFQKHATHMEFDFPEKKGTGIARLLKHISKQCVDLLEKLLIYDPDDRITASQALKHPYFKDLRENEVRYAFSTTQPLMYPQQHSDKDDRSTKLVSKPKKPKKLNKLSNDLEELPPIKRKDPAKKIANYGKTTLFYPKKKSKKFVSPYMKKKISKFSKLD